MTGQRTREAEGMASLRQIGVEESFEAASLWWTLAATSSSARSILPQVDDQEIATKCRLYDCHASRRTRLEAADMTAAAVAKNDLATNHLLAAARAWVTDRLYTTVGYVGDLVGAAMAYRPNWARVPRVDFGAEMRHVHFMLTPGIVMLNSASVACLARPVAQSRREWARRIQLDTVQWRFKAKSLKLSQATDKICQKVRARPSDASVVPSFADATATVLRSMSWVPTDRILVVHHSHFFKNVFPQIQQLSSLNGIDVVIVHLDLLEAPRQVAERFRRALRRVMPRLAIVPHLLDDGQLVPVSQIVSDCAAAGCLSVVDGSLAVGNVDVDISGINADVYIARLDVYCFCYPGTTLIVTNAARYNCLETLTVSYFHGKGYADEWRYYGHSDHSLWLCATQAFQFQKFICFNYEDYCGRMARKSVRYLCEAWGVSPLRDDQDEEEGSIVTVPFPYVLGKTSADALALSSALEAWGIFVGIITFNLGEGQVGPHNSDILIACRLTCNVFNTATDVQRLAAAVRVLADQRRRRVGEST